MRLSAICDAQIASQLAVDLDGQRLGRVWLMRRVVEDCVRIDAYKALRQGLFGRDSTSLVFTHGGLRYEVGIGWRQVSVGGVRPNLLCPGCNEPKVKLVLIAPGKLQCQKCSGLPNRSRQQTRFSRAAETLRKLQRLTGSEDWENVSQPVLRRPKRMHYATFERLVNRGKAAYEILAQSPWSEDRPIRPLQVLR